MNRQREQVQQQTGTPQQLINGASDAEAQANGLVEQAREVQAEQASLVDRSSVENKYSEALAAQIERKHEQAERIEDRLERLIDQQSARLQQARSEQPGAIALPGTRAKWQKQLMLQESAMQRLQGRLELVREIKDGMAMRGPRIQDMAARKLRLQEPGLASEWEELQEERRRRRILQRMKEQEQRPQQIQLAGTVPGLSHTLAISLKK